MEDYLLEHRFKKNNYHIETIHIFYLFFHLDFKDVLII